MLTEIPQSLDNDLVTGLIYVVMKYPANSRMQDCIPTKQQTFQVFIFNDLIFHGC